MMQAVQAVQPVGADTALLADALSAHGRAKNGVEAGTTVGTASIAPEGGIRPEPDMGSILPPENDTSQ